MAIKTMDCTNCDGEGEVEVQTAVDCFRDDPCDLCSGSGKIVDHDATEKNIEQT